MSDSVILALIGLASTVFNIVLGGLLAAWVSRRHAKSKALVFAAEGETMKAQAALDQERTDNQIRIELMKVDVEERAFIREQLKAQVQLNDKFQTLLIEKEARDESNYRVVSAVQKDNTTAVLNLHNTVREQGKGMAELLVTSLAALQTNYSQQMTELNNLNKVMITELGQVISRAMELRDVNRAMYPFPDFEDARWHEVLLAAVKSDVVIYREPRYWDEARLVKSCAGISIEPQPALVIEDILNEWYAVQRTLNGVHCWGWVQKHYVRITEAEASLYETTVES